MKLQRVIENSELDELSVPARCIQSDFIQAAIRTAKNSMSTTRDKILKDVSLMLNCNVEDLGFLFQKNIDNNKPKIYKLDLPDYRLTSSEIYLEAAE